MEKSRVRLFDMGKNIEKSRFDYFTLRPGLNWLVTVVLVIINTKTFLFLLFRKNHFIWNKDR